MYLPLPLKALLARLEIRQTYDSVLNFHFFSSYFELFRERTRKLIRRRETHKIEIKTRGIRVMTDNNNIHFQEPSGIHSSSVAPIRSPESERRLRLEDLGTKWQDSFSRTSTLTNDLNLKPGENNFLTWYFISSSFPIVAASIGPIANLGSVAALVSPWRLNDQNDSIPDYHWILGTNAFSLFLGCVSNISLFLNFSGRINYTVSQIISIGGWYIASLLLLGLTASSKHVYFTEPGIKKSQGFYYACLTCPLYFISSTMLLLNEIGHLRGQYSASFNLTRTQRRIMMQVVVLMIWIGAGGGLFSHLIDISYPDGIYYCVVTISTIGLGDIVPVTALARALCLAYAIIGLIILGLVVTAIRNLVLETNSAAATYHRVEKKRMKKYRHILKESQSETVPPCSTFETIKKIHINEESRSTTYSVYISVLTFCFFWLVGSMVFYLSQTWTYFEAVYFCALCLMTIGYGDFAPAPEGIGRPFFVVWAIAAVPMMTILISNLGDTLFAKVSEGGDLVTAWLLAVYSVRKNYFDFWKTRKEKRILMQSNNDDLEQRVRLEQVRRASIDLDNQLGLSPAAIDDVIESASNHADEPDPNRMLVLIREIHRLGRIANSEPEMSFSYEEWKRLLALTAIPTSMVKTDDVDPAFWLSERSPLRYPIDEARFFIRKCIQALEFDIIKLVEESDNSGYVRDDKIF